MRRTSRRDAGSNGRRDVEGRDSVGMYLDEIARTPLLDAAQEVELSKSIEAGLLAEQLLADGRVGRRKGGAPGSANQEGREWVGGGGAGGRAGRGRGGRRAGGAAARVGPPARRTRRSWSGSRPRAGGRCSGS